MEDVSQPDFKRQKLAYHHRHSIQHKQPPQIGEPTLLPTNLLDKLVIEGVKTLCEEEAHKQDISEPWVESVALEALRASAEEFISNLCSKVRRSMLAARRTVPIATDFDSAFFALDLPRPDDQLSRYESGLEIDRSLLPTPPPDDEFHHVHNLPSNLLGPELSRQSELKRFGFNLSSLPPLPSAHTYSDTPVFSSRETDSRKIRELATEEGKLGEQALRKLAGAVKLETALSAESEAKVMRARRGLRARRYPVLTEEAVFEETMRDLLRQEKGDFELGPVVSSEKAYRMPDESRAKRRPATRAGQPTSQVGSAQGPAKYNLLPPPVGRGKPSGSSQPAAADAMDMTLEL